jgi:CRP/FNR family transcriptional regulator, anaerobic regulatory protein
MTPCTFCPLRKFPIFAPMTEDEVRFMMRFKRAERVVRAGTTFLLEGFSSLEIYTVLSGLGTRFKTLEGGERQVVNFLFPGDFVGLQAGVLGEMKHSATAATDMVLCVFERGAFWSMFKKHSERAFDVTWLSAVEEHFLGETLAAVGRHDAETRIAWALWRIHRRLAAVGLARDGVVPFALRQQDLADALGLSLVHTNKTLARLRDAGIADWTGGILRVPDMARLAQRAGRDTEPPEVRPLI